MAAPKSRLRRIVVLCLKLGVVIFLSTVVLVVLLRFVHPPVTGLMLERRIASIWNKTAYSPKYAWVDFDTIPPEMGLAVIAAEDQKFPAHHGFDIEAIQKAVAFNEENTRTRGASTISQQAAKNMFLWSGRNWVRKGGEVYFTVLMELIWGKRRILESYLNIVEFGDGIYGVEAASQRYFKKHASALTASDAAILAAVLPNPRRYSVTAPGPYVKERQQWILQQMDQLGGPAFIKKMK